MLIRSLEAKVKGGRHYIMVVADPCKYADLLNHPRRRCLHHAAEQRKYPVSFVKGDFHHPCPFTGGQQRAFTRRATDEQDVYACRDEPPDHLAESRFIDAILIVYRGNNRDDNTR